MSKRRFTIAACVATIALGTGAGFAFGGGTGIWDDGRMVQTGSLDDGKDLLPQTTVTLDEAVATAQHAASGALGQVDLERHSGRVVYVVDVGDQEVSVDAVDGGVAGIAPRD
jgi:uncharacterized membrane protein YkoI